MKDSVAVISVVMLLAFALFLLSGNLKTDSSEDSALQSAFDAGRYFSAGWSGAEQAYGIRWVKGIGWVSERCVSTNAPSADREMDFYNVSTSRPSGARVNYKPKPGDQ